MEITRFLPLLGRLLIGLPFLVSGLGKLAAFGPTTAYISSVGLPLAPLGWAIAVAFEVGGGVLLILGFRAREVASGLAVFTLATAIFFHHDFADRNQMIHFLKNIMIIGGLLQIAHFGAGRFSLDALRSRDPEMSPAPPPRAPNIGQFPSIRGVGSTGGPVASDNQGRNRQAS